MKKNTPTTKDPKVNKHNKQHTPEKSKKNNQNDNQEAKNEKISVKKPEPESSVIKQSSIQSKDSQDSTKRKRRRLAKPF